MKKITIAFIFSLLGSLPLVAQNTFQHSYGTIADEVPLSFTQTFDKGFALLGFTDSSYGYIVKTDSIGNKVWSKKYNIVLGYNGRIIQTSDKGYLISNASTLLKLDSIGNVSWTRSYTDNFNKLLQIPGGYILAGSDSNANPMCMKTNTAGTILWTSKALNNSGDAMFDVIQLGYDSCFYLISINRIIKVDKNGNSIWSKYIYVNGSKGYGQNNEIDIDPNGKSIDCLLKNGAKNYWFSIDTSGIVIDTLSLIVNSSYASNVHYCRGNGNSLIFTCSISDTIGNSYYAHIYLLMTDAIGNVKWATRIGGEKQDYPAGVLQIRQGNIVVFGATQNFSVGADDFYLIQTDSAGNSSCSQYPFPVNKIPSENITLNPDNIFNPIPNASSAPIIVLTQNIKDTNFNDCLCYAPKAGFYYDQYMGYFSDSSTWATHWYWSFGNGTYDSTHVSPHTNYKDTGMYYVCLKVKNNCGAMDSTCQWIDYQLPTVGINAVVDNNKTIVFPNPFTTNSTVQFSKTGKHYLELDDITGRQLRTMECNSTDYILQRNGLAQGIYILNVFDSQMKYETSLKLIVE